MRDVCAFVIESDVNEIIVPVELVRNEFIHPLQHRMLITFAYSFTNFPIFTNSIVDLIKQLKYAFIIKLELILYCLFVHEFADLIKHLKYGFIITNLNRFCTNRNAFSIHRNDAIIISLKFVHLRFIRI